MQPEESEEYGTKATSMVKQRFENNSSNSEISIIAL
jgi:hypothetical protein